MDPDDGTNRTPKGLLHSGSLQIPIKQLAGLISEREDGTQLHPLTETVMDVLPSMGSISIGGSIATEKAAEHTVVEGRQIVQETVEAAKVRCFTLGGSVTVHAPWV